MNAKKMFGLLACAAASAVAMNAYANTTTNWFSGAAAATTPSATGGAWNNNYASSTAEAITIDNDYSTALTLTPTTASPAQSDGLVTITSTAVLTPCAASDLPASTSISDAKVGFAVAVEGKATNYYYYANSTWTASGTAVANPAAATTFTITMDYRTNKAAFSVGETSVASDVTFTGSTLTDVAAFGTGSISSIAAKYEVAVCAVGDKKYGSVADAKAAGGTTSTIKQVNSSGVVQEATTAANGLDVATCMALGLSTTDASSNIAVAPVGTDDDTTKITLAVDVTGASDAGVVKFGVKKGDGEPKYYDNPAAIKIPLEAGTYTITPTLK